jgi:hypothetical protein
MHSPVFLKEQRPDLTWTCQAQVYYIVGRVVKDTDTQTVIPAQAGIQCLFGWLKSLDPGLRRGDDDSPTDGNFVDSALVLLC